MGHSYRILRFLAFLLELFKKFALSFSIPWVYFPWVFFWKMAQKKACVYAGTTITAGSVLKTNIAQESVGKIDYAYFLMNSRCPCDFKTFSPKTIVKPIEGEQCLLKSSLWANLHISCVFTLHFKKVSSWILCVGVSNVSMKKKIQCLLIYSFVCVMHGMVALKNAIYFINEVIEACRRH